MPYTYINQETTHVHALTSTQRARSSKESVAEGCCQDCLLKLSPRQVWSTRAAHAWVEEHLPSDATWWCGAVVVEWRYIGDIVNLRHTPDGDWPRERIGSRRDDGRVVYIRWSKRVLVLRQASEADGWLRRQLALLGAR